MMDKAATKLVERLRSLSRELRLGDDLGRAAIQDAVAFIRDQTEPLTLEECRDVLNTNKHLYSRLERSLSCDFWELDGDRLVKGEAFHTRFEATAFARAYLAQGGAS